MMCRTGKTQRMIDYAIAAARQGRELAIICNSDAHRQEIHKRLLKSAEEAGCKWVVGNGIDGGNGGNIETYQVNHALVMEHGPGGYDIRGNRKREVLVDNYVLEDRYGKVLENYIRWI